MKSVVTLADAGSTPATSTKPDYRRADDHCALPFVNGQRWSGVVGV